MSTPTPSARKRIQMENENDVKPGPGEARKAVQILEDETADAASSRCFITTACVRARGMADDCEILTLLRGFRDGYMMTTPASEEMVADYYNVAPRIVAAIDATSEPEPIYDAIYEILVDCAEGIKNEAFEDALDTYKGMVTDLTDRYCPSTARPPSVGTLSVAPVA
jgi:hypothetical protein